MLESWHVTFHGVVEVDTLSKDHPYKQIYDAVHTNGVNQIRIVTADPIGTHREDD